MSDICSEIGKNCVRDVSNIRIVTIKDPTGLWFPDLINELSIKWGVKKCGWEEWEDKIATIGRSNYNMFFFL